MLCSFYSLQQRKTSPLWQNLFPDWLALLQVFCQKEWDCDQTGRWLKGRLAKATHGKCQYTTFIKTYWCKFCHGFWLRLLTMPPIIEKSRFEMLVVVAVLVWCSTGRYHTDILKLDYFALSKLLFWNSAQEKVQKLHLKSHIMCEKLVKMHNFLVDTYNSQEFAQTN